MVDAADVLRDRAPEVGGGAVERRDVRVRVDVAQEVPGGVDERVHRVCLARALLAALRARRVQPLRIRGERRHALRPVVLDLRQQHRQLVFRHGDDAAIVAVDDRDRGAPVPLPREAPVTQAIRDRGLGLPVLPQGLHDRGATLVGGQAVELTRRNEHAVLGHDFHDRQAERLRELAVALVVRRHGHDRARPVLHEHVVGDIDGQPFAVHGIDRVEPGEDARLHLLAGRPRRGGRRSASRTPAPPR